MSDTRTVHDPFLGKDVQVSDKLVDRLRGKYASGPHLPNGNPEFGWKQFQAPPIQHEAAAEIEYLRTLLLNAVNEYPMASGVYVDQDGQAGYGSLKAMRLHLGIAPSRGFLHIPDPAGTGKET